MVLKIKDFITIIIIMRKWTDNKLSKRKKWSSNKLVVLIIIVAYIYIIILDIKFISDSPHVFISRMYLLHI